MMYFSFNMKVFIRVIVSYCNKRGLMVSSRICFYIEQRLQLHV